MSTKEMKTIKFNPNSEDVYEVVDATARQSLNDKQDTSNLVTTISAQSTDTQYPSAKCIYDIVGNVEAALRAIRGL